MSYYARVVADSVGPTGSRLTSIEVCYPLSVHQDHLRHRVFSFSVASNRAIPTRDYIARVIDDPAHPEKWGANQSGMIAQNELVGWRRWLVMRLWLGARWPAIVIAWLCWRLGAHKEIVNWLLMPWAWTTVLVTGTDWSNFYALRKHHAARAEMRRLAFLMSKAHEDSVPVRLRAGQWHLPYVRTEELATMWQEQACRVSAARCARISLLKQGDRRELLVDMAKADELQTHGHMSPFEHQAEALAHDARIANLQGFSSYRSTIQDEQDFALILASRQKAGLDV